MADLPQTLYSLRDTEILAGKVDAIKVEIDALTTNLAIANSKLDDIMVKLDV